MQKFYWFSFNTNLWRQHKKSVKLMLKWIKSVSLINIMIPIFNNYSPISFHVKSPHFNFQKNYLQKISGDLEFKLHSPVP